MNLLAYNPNDPNSDLSWESFTIRTGLLLSELSFAIGGSPFYIMYQQSMMQMNVQNKVKLMIQSADLADHRLALMQMEADLKTLRNRKNKNQRDLVFLKQTEKAVEQWFEGYVEERTSQLRRFGLPQLSALEADRQNGLRLWYYNKDHGETHEPAPISEVLGYEYKEGGVMATDVMAFGKSFTEILMGKVEMSHLCTLPNLNSLQPNQLLSARARLAPWRQELDRLIPLMKPAEGEKRFYTGTWQLDELKTFSVRLQEAINNTPELEWSAKVQPDAMTHILVGSMETTALWQLMRDNDHIPDDTWPLLERRMRDGDHCKQIPLLSLSLAEEGQENHHFTEEESLQHRRKTIDLD